MLPAQQPAEPPPAFVAEVAKRVDVYGRLDGNLAFSRDDVSVQNNSSRFGIMAEESVIGGLTVLGQGEWRMNLGRGDTTYNISENPDIGFPSYEAATSQAFTTRLGFVGLRFGKFGTLTLGKQWGVYYDVSAWTDLYIVFGAHGSSTYNAGTDGGQTGEGRANDALTYRVAFGPLRVGVQAQFLSERSGPLDGLSGSAVYAFGGGLRAGVAYSHSFLDPGSNVVGYDGKDARAFTAGVTFDKNGWRLAAVNTWTHDHELVQASGVSVMYDTLGAELFTSRRFGDLMAVLGFDFAIPRGLDTRFVNPNYGTRDVMAGARLILDSAARSFVYLEGRTGATRDASGERAEDVLMLGIRFEYSLRRALGLERMTEWRLKP